MGSGAYLTTKEEQVWEQKQKEEIEVDNEGNSETEHLQKKSTCIEEELIHSKEDYLKNTQISMPFVEEESELPSMALKKEDTILSQMKIEESVQLIENSYEEYKQPVSKESCNLQYQNSIEPSQKTVISQIQQSNPEREVMSEEKQVIHKFDGKSMSSSIKLEEEGTFVVQGSPYYENNKLALTEPIKSNHAGAVFKIDSLRYCVGVGLAFREVIEKHEYTYQSNANQLGHGLYIVTSQGFSWSHSEKQQDDIFRETFNQVYPGTRIQVTLLGSYLTFKWKKGEFTLTVPSDLLKKYTPTFCAYVHEKGDAISLQ